MLAPKRPRIGIGWWTCLWRIDTVIRQTTGRRALLATRTTCGWRIVISPMIPRDSQSCYDSAMRNLFVLFIHLIAGPYRKCYPARTPFKSATSKKKEMQAGPTKAIQNITMLYCYIVILHRRLATVSIRQRQDHRQRGMHFHRHHFTVSPSVVLIVCISHTKPV